MVWSQLEIDKPHLAYMILGGFTSLFMLCSLFVKERLYIGEATVATLCGIIFGPYAAKLFDPNTWTDNVDKLTLECARIVLVVQCFAVGVELPKSYMERHWKSLVMLLVPVMTWGWLVTSLFVWWLVPTLNWLEGLVCAACVTATDPVLASSVVGKGKFSRRVPKHLRDLLSAESGCNDGMAFPFIYLSVFLVRFHLNGAQVTKYWFCNIILYECIFGAFYGVVLGYAARRLIRFAEEKNLIDRESFLAFYFVLALFCAGSGSLLGLDDLLVGFSAGVGFSNDGWFTEKTEESHVSNVIDLLLNLAFFVYFGSIIPWHSYNDSSIGLDAWRLVVIAILVIFFRRIPAMLLLKPIIPDLKTWREAWFAGHFGPIGVGAIFAAILARAEMEHEGAEPLPKVELPRPGSEHYYIVQVIWPLTTFMVISSIIVHGSSIAVFMLGKHINTLTLTLSYTTVHNDQGPSWMSRLPRVPSLRKSDSGSSSDQQQEFPPGTLGPVGVPGNFLRRVKLDEKDGILYGPGGPISQSAIFPQRPPEAAAQSEGKPAEGVEIPTEPEKDQEQRADIEREGAPLASEQGVFGHETEMNVYKVGDHLVMEDSEGNVLKVENAQGEFSEEQQRRIEQQEKRLQEDQSVEIAKSKQQLYEKTTPGEQTGETVKQKSGLSYQALRERLGEWAAGIKGKTTTTTTTPTGGKAVEKPQPEKRTRQSARAYQFGNTIVIEDENGEVIKTYTIPGQPSIPGKETQLWLKGISKWVGMGDGEPSQRPNENEEDDDGLRFTVAQDPRDKDRPGIPVSQGRRMSKQDFIREISKLDSRARRTLAGESDAPASKEAVAKSLESQQQQQRDDDATAEPARRRPVPRRDNNDEGNIAGETAVERKRRLAALGKIENSDNEDDDGVRRRELPMKIDLPRSPVPAVVRESPPPSDADQNRNDATQDNNGSTLRVNNQVADSASSSSNGSNNESRQRISWGGERGR